jgi:hypothetical protein
MPWRCNSDSSQTLRISIRVDCRTNAGGQADHSFEQGRPRDRGLIEDKRHARFGPECANNSIARAPSNAANENLSRFRPDEVSQSAFNVFKVAADRTCFRSVVGLEFFPYVSPAPSRPRIGSSFRFRAVLLRLRFDMLYGPSSINGCDYNPQPADVDNTVPPTRWLPIRNLRASLADGGTRAADFAVRHPVMASAGTRAGTVCRTVGQLQTSI